MKIVINTLERKADSGFVTTVHWTVLKNNGVHTASHNGTDSFKHAEGDLIPYENLTAEIVTGWLIERWGEEGLAEKEAILNADLAAAAAPKIVFGTPWKTA